MTTTNTFISLAVLKTNWESGKSDYIDNFKPFVICCLECSEKKELCLSEITSCIEEKFGLKMPDNSIKTILRRLTRKKEVSLNDGMYSLLKETNIKEKLELSTQEFLRHYNAVISALTDFALNEGIDGWDNEKSESELLFVLKDYTFSLLNTALKGSPLPEISKESDTDRYIVSKFIGNIHDESPDLFSYLETVLKGSMLTNALAFSDLSSIKKKIKNLSIYLDTNFILSLLGKQGEEEFEACNAIIDLCIELGVDLKCFAHTQDECISVMRTVAIKLRNGDRSGYGPLYLNCLKKGTTAGDLDLEILSLDKNLKKLKIKIDNEQVINNYQDYDEAELEDILKDNIYYREDNENALIRDIRSIQGINNYRKGKCYLSFEDCRSIFLSTNTRLCVAANKFAKNSNKDLCVPQVMTDSMVANLLWLKNPNIAPDLPEKELMSRAYSGMQPSGELWRKYLDQVKKLKDDNKIDEDDLILLTHSNVISNELMDLTKGDPSNINDDLIPEGLQRVKAAMVNEKDIELTQEKHKRFWLEKSVERNCERRASIYSFIVTGTIFVSVLLGLLYSTEISEGYKGYFVTVYIISTIAFTYYALVPLYEFLYKKLKKYFMKEYQPYK